MSKVIINHGNIAKLDRDIQRALVATAGAIKEDVIDKQVMPFDQSTLQGSLFVDDRKINDAKIVANTSYARRLYYHPEYHYQTGNNRNAGGKYFEPWTSKGKYANWVVKRFGEFVKMFGDV